MVLQRFTSRCALAFALMLVATVMFTAVRAAPAAEAATVSNHWWGVSVNLSWTETRYVGTYGGVAGCAYIAARAPTPLVKAGVAVGCYALSQWAKYAYRYGYCMSFKVVRWPSVAVFPWVRRC